MPMKSAWGAAASSNADAAETELNYTNEDRALALAGVFQAGALVADVAHGRSLEPVAFRATLNSLFIENPDSTREVFGDLPGIRLGLLLVRDAFRNDRSRGQAEVLRYALNILHVERRFSRKPELLQKLDSRLQRVRQQLEHFDLEHDTIIGALADTYQQTLSTLPQRIQVMGNPNALQNERNAGRIRAILLGGVRAAVLFHQVGGRRWRLILNRGPILAATARLIDSLPPPDAEAGA